MEYAREDGYDTANNHLTTTFKILAGKSFPVNNSDPPVAESKEEKISAEVSDTSPELDSVAEIIDEVVKPVAEVVQIAEAEVDEIEGEDLMQFSQNSVVVDEEKECSVNTFPGKLILVISVSYTVCGEGSCGWSLCEMV